MAGQDLVFVYMTAGSRAEAETIGRALVEERLAACVNLLGSMTSIYRWEGAVETAEEVAFVAKTTAGLFDRLAERVRALHSYEVPCVVALPVDLGSPAYLAWLRRETA
ncbi:divalent-cation tolerance protein CutA [Azospirillum sp. ST 5-10]|uniref:divalent-cation tolerance protein CutA n=1 Tax=unclassified Azospirillum TaxID=2630922 RepID=UPI003F49CA99